MPWMDKTVLFQHLLFLRLHNEDLHNLYASPSIVRAISYRRMRWTRYEARMGEKRNAFSILVGKPEDCKMRIVITCTLHQILLRSSTQGG